MRFIDSGVDNNYVDYSLAGNSHDGLGGEHMRTCSRAIRAHKDVTEHVRRRCAACSGGVFLNHYNFDLDNISLSGNAAYYGAGLYVSTDVTSNASLSSLALSNNVGMLGVASTAVELHERFLGRLCTEECCWLSGTAIYWLHSKSPLTPVTCTSCTVSPAGAGAIATEAIALQFLVSPPTAVQSNEVRTFTGRQAYWHIA